METPRITDEELDAMEKRANLATPGPWKKANITTPTKHARVRLSICRIDGMQVKEVIARDVRGPNGWDEGEKAIGNDAAFIANARDDVPALIAEVRRLRKEAE